MWFSPQHFFFYYTTFFILFPLCYSCVWSAISSGKLTVIEGNNVNYPNDRVRRREISSASSLIFGYARPKYPVTDSANGSDVNISLPTVRKGDTGNVVKILQAFLVAYEYSIGISGIDGDFGSDTESAVRQFQKRSCIAVDGIVGKDTWAELLSESNF